MRFVENTIKMNIHIICERENNNPATIYVPIYQETRIQDVATNWGKLPFQELYIQRIYFINQYRGCKAIVIYV